VNADYAAVSALIALGAYLGKTSFSECFSLSTVCIVMYGLNKVICINILGTNDRGGSVVVHAFGAYFGITAAS
jgi:ammonium transporter Rh